MVYTYSSLALVSLCYEGTLRPEWDETGSDVSPERTHCCIERWGKDNCFQQPVRKGERKNMGIAANLIKMLVVSTYGLHYGIQLPVVTPIGLYLRFLADGGRPAVPLRPKDHKGNLQVDSGNPLVWLWFKHMPTFSTNVCIPVQRVASGLERLQMSLSHFDDTLHAQRHTPRLRHRWRPSGGNPLPIFFLDQPECFLCGSGDRNPNMPMIIAGL